MQPRCCPRAERGCCTPRQIAVLTLSFPPQQKYFITFFPRRCETTFAGTSRQANDLKAVFAETKVSWRKDLEVANANVAGCDVQLNKYLGETEPVPNLPRFLSILFSFCSRSSEIWKCAFIPLVGPFLKTAPLVNTATHARANPITLLSQISLPNSFCVWFC